MRRRIDDSKLKAVANAKAKPALVRKKRLVPGTITQSEANSCLPPNSRIWKHTTIRLDPTGEAWCRREHAALARGGPTGGGRRAGLDQLIPQAGYQLPVGVGLDLAEV